MCKTEARFIRIEIVRAGPPSGGWSLAGQLRRLGLYVISGQLSICEEGKKDVNNVVKRGPPWIIEAGRGS